MAAEDAARDIELGPYADWLDWERVVINVEAVYREIDPSPAPGRRDEPVPGHGRAEAAQVTRAAGRR